MALMDSIGEYQEASQRASAGESEGLTSSGHYWTTQPGASNDIEAFFTGKKKISDLETSYRDYLRESASAREAREFEKREADNAWQRKVADLRAAGFSPLAALDASGQGAAVASAQTASSNTQGAGNPTGAILASIIGAIAMIASRGASAAASSASGAAKLEASRNNLLAAVLRGRK